MFNISQGKVEIQGKTADLYASDVDFIELVGIVKPNEKDFDTFNRQNSEALSSRSSSTSTLGCSINENEYCQINEGAQLEASSKGKVKGSILMNYFNAGVRWPVFIALLFLFVFAQFLASSVDYWVSAW